MSDALQIPNDLMQRALSWAAQQRFESVDMESVTLLTAEEAAKMLKITPRAFRNIAVDSIDFGERRARYSLKDIKALIEKRRIKRS